MAAIFDLSNVNVINRMSDFKGVEDGADIMFASIEGTYELGTYEICESCGKHCVVNCVTVSGTAVNLLMKFATPIILDEIYYSEEFGGSCCVDCCDKYVNEKLNPENKTILDPIN